MEFVKKRFPKPFIEVKSKYETIKNTPEFMAAAAQYNYDKKHMKQGEALITIAEQLCLDQQRKYHESYEATREFNETVKKMKTIYAKHSKIARVFLFSNKQKQIDLGLNGQKSASFESFSDRYCFFYYEVQKDPELLRQFAGCNIAPMEMKQAMSLLAKAEQCKDKQQELLAKAKEATKQRNTAIEAAHRWCSELSAFASLPPNRGHISHRLKTPDTAWYLKQRSRALPVLC